MDSVLLEPPAFLGFFPPASPGYDSVLRESISRFLVEVRREPRDLSGLRSVFSRLLQSSPDPPLEVIWFYSAVTYHESGGSSASERVAAVWELFQLLTACSASCGGPKSVALLAPVLSELYKCLSMERRGSGSLSKKLAKEAESLVEGVLSYVVVCSGRSSADEGDSGRLLSCFPDLVSVWGNGLGDLFPLVNDDVRKEIGKEGCGVGYVAGAVMAEAFLMRLYLKVWNAGDFRAELSKELRIWAVSSVSVFRNPIFFEILLRLLLESCLPFISLSPNDEKVVQEILFDALILVDYSFLYDGIEAEQFYDQAWSLHVMRLIMTHEAIKISMAVSGGDRSQAISYISAFSTSGLPNGLIKLVQTRFGIEKFGLPSAATPHAMLEWLVGLEACGLKLFPDDMSKLREFFVFDDRNAPPPPRESLNAVDGKATDADLFFLDREGCKGPESHAAAVTEAEVMQTADASSFPDAAWYMGSAPSETRKRKEYVGNGAAALANTACGARFVRYKLQDDSLKGYFKCYGANGIDSGSGSEVDNVAASSDCDMEDS